MNKILLPQNYNYIGVFLTLRCNLACNYCINKFGETKKYEELSGDAWINGLKRIETREDLPITLQGGEPTIHKSFYEIANGLYSRGKFMDLLTNGLFDINEFTSNISPDVFWRRAKYASIRFSFHYDTDLMGLAMKVFELKKLKRYSIGIWGLTHPWMKHKNDKMKELCKWLGIDFRMKEFLDEHHGEYKYPEAISGKQSDKIVQCRPSELLIAPNGDIFTCHSNLYAGLYSIGNILDEELNITDEFRACNRYGLCNYCDQKIKFDRFQNPGHTSVEIKFD